MATRHGYATLKWLVQRGWRKAPVDKPRKGDFVCGDQRVIDSDNKEMSVYEAAKLQRARTGEYPDFLSD